jgi:hypothetical protein
MATINISISTPSDVTDEDAKILQRAWGADLAPTLKATLLAQIPDLVERSYAKLNTDVDLRDFYANSPDATRTAVQEAIGGDVWVAYNAADSGTQATVLSQLGIDDEELFPQAWWAVDGTTRTAVKTTLGL